MGQLSPIRALNVQRKSCEEQLLVFALIVTTWWLSQPGEKLGSYPLLEVLLSQETPARSSCRLLYLFVDISWDSQLDGVEQLSPIRAVIVTRISCAEQSQVFMPPRQYFLRLSTSMELSSYPPLEVLLSQEAPARRSCRFLCLLVDIYWDSQLQWNWQLSPIRGVIVSRNSCTEQLQIVVSFHQYFSRLPTGWSWAAIPH